MAAYFYAEENQNNTLSIKFNCISHIFLGVSVEA
jgi:hypothetical protein